MLLCLINLDISNIVLNLHNFRSFYLKWWGRRRFYLYSIYCKLRVYTVKEEFMQLTFDPRILEAPKQAGRSDLSFLVFDNKV